MDYKLNYKHIPILLNEVVNGLNIKPDGVYFDLTAGGGGHSEGIAKCLSQSEGRLFCLDRDPDAVSAASERLSDYPNVKVIHSVYNEVDDIAFRENVNGIDGILMDLGISSFQVDNSERGFSYLKDGPLDMRMSKDGITAAELISTLSCGELAAILRNYGDERFALPIARAIINQNQKCQLTTTGQLAEIVTNSIPAKFKRIKNPCKRTFQALRIAVNNENDLLDETIKKSFKLLKKNGRIAIITFHSKEDKLVQGYFKNWVKGCTCPSDFPICVCGNLPKAKYVSRLITPSKDEQAENRRSKSAKLRIIEKLV